MQRAQAPPTCSHPVSRGAGVCPLAGQLGKVRSVLHRCPTGWRLPPMTSAAGSCPVAACEIVDCDGLRAGEEEGKCGGSEAWERCHKFSDRSEDCKAAQPALFPQETQFLWCCPHHQHEHTNTNINTNTHQPTHPHPHTHLGIQACSDEQQDAAARLLHLCLHMLSTSRLLWVRAFNTVCTIALLITAHHRTSTR